MSAKKKFPPKRLFCAFVLMAALLSSQCALAVAAEEPELVESVQIKMSFGSGIDSETRDLVGESDVFPSSVEKVFCYTKITGANAPTTYTHAWYFKGKTRARVDLNIGTSSWRTWSSKRIMSHWVGLWEVKVLDDSGQVLATGNFEIN